METPYKFGTVWRSRDGSKFVVASEVNSTGQIIVWDTIQKESLLIDARDGRYVLEGVVNGNDLVGAWED
jgi:hypothetical protein